jgi:transketolase
MYEVVADIRRLMSLLTGDEKHDASATSTLDVLAVLYERVLRFDPARPDWSERDRFLLSKGHGPMAFYATLAHAGYFPEDELARFLRRDGILGAHPDRHLVPGVEVSTGSLGHGLAMGVGVAHALQARGLSEPRVFVLCGDAELNEGSNWEAILYAGSRPLGNLTLIVVDNRSGAVPVDSIAGKIAAFGWSTTTVDGRHHDEIEAALRNRTSGPSAVVAKVD